MPSQKRTKIVCTIGPSCQSIEQLTKLAKSGMNVARLNFSHGTHSEYKQIIKNIRKTEKILNQTIAILQDLQGPKIRIGKLPETITIKKSQQFIIDTEAQEFTPGKTPVFPTTYPNLAKDLKKGDLLLIDDGLIENIVTKIQKNKIHLKSLTGGLISSHKGINLPNSSITANTITEKDKKDLKFGLKQQVDFVALSFVKDHKDILELKKLIKKDSPKIIAKIERHEALKHLTKITQVVDALMVARGDLGVDIPAAQVPIVQKKLIHLANIHAKPVITATQVLYSMTQNPRPTRAEVSDAANAIYDHTDAIMLSNETATGKYPQKSTKTLANIALTVENELQQHQELLEHYLQNSPYKNFNASCLNACELAIDSQAHFIVNFTENGYTAREIAKHRPYTPIITLTNNKQTLRELALTWGLNINYLIKLKATSKNKNQKILKFLQKNHLIPKNKKAVIITNASKENSTITLETT